MIAHPYIIGAMATRTLVNITSFLSPQIYKQYFKPGNLYQNKKVYNPRSLPRNVLYKI